MHKSSCFDYPAVRKDFISIIHHELEMLNTHPENAILDDISFSIKFASNLDSIAFRKFSSRVSSDGAVIKVGHSDSILTNSTLVECIITIKSFFNASRTASISFNEGDFSNEVIVEHHRKFHPFIEILADRMQNKLNSRKRKVW